MTETYHFTIPGRPPSKNTDKVTVRVLSARSRSFEKRVDQLATLHRWPRITSGLWRIEVTGFYPERNRKLTAEAGRDVPDADSGAPTQRVKDALQNAGVVDNDSRIDDDVARRGYDKENPRVEVTLTRIDP